MLEMVNLTDSKEQLLEENVNKIKLGLALVTGNHELYSILSEGGDIDDAFERNNRKVTLDLLSFSFKAAIVTSSANTLKRIIKFANEQRAQLTIDEEAI